MQSREINLGYLWQCYEDNTDDGFYRYFASVESAKSAFEECGEKRKEYGVAIVEEDGEIVPDTTLEAIL